MKRMSAGEKDCRIFATPGERHKHNKVRKKVKEAITKGKSKIIRIRLSSRTHINSSAHIQSGLLLLRMVLRKILFKRH